MWHSNASAPLDTRWKIYKEAQGCAKVRDDHQRQTAQKLQVKMKISGTKHKEDNLIH